MKTLIVSLMLLSATAFGEDSPIVRDWVNNWAKPTYTGDYHDRGFIPMDQTFQNQQPPAQRRQQNCHVEARYDFASGQYQPQVVCE